MEGKNSYLKPQDIIVLLKILVKKDETWRIIDLSYELNISSGEISNALERLRSSSLISSDKKTVLLSNLKEFLIHGLKYAFPAKLGSIERGIATAHSVGKLQKKIVSDTKYIWPDANGDTKGLSVSPLYKNASEASIKDPKLHLLLALIDSIRIGKVREQVIAKQLLEKEIKLYEL